MPREEVHRKILLLCASSAIRAAFEPGVPGRRRPGSGLRWLWWLRVWGLGFWFRAAGLGFRRAVVAVAPQVLCLAASSPPRHLPDSIL